ALIFTRQKLPVIDRRANASADGLRCGAYVLHENAKGTPDLILMASGSEVSLVAQAAMELARDNIGVRVVSMPCWDLFEAQSEDYRERILPRHVGARLAVEAGASLGWDRYVGSRGDMITVDRFGASAPGETVFEHYGFSVANVVKRARALLQ